MFSKQLLILFAIYFIASSKKLSDDDDNLLKLIVRLVKAQSEPRTFAAIVCWKRQKIFTLFKALNENGIYASFQTFQSDIKETQQISLRYIYFTDLNCPQTKEFLNIANKQLLFHYPNKWFIITKNSELENYSMPVNSRVYLIEESLNGTHIESIYKLDNATNYIHQDIAFAKKSNFEYWNNLFDTRNRSDLQGTLFHISSVVYFEETKDYDFTNFRKLDLDKPYKFCALSTDSLLDSYNVTKQIKYYKKWGTPNPKTGIYDGKYRDFQLGLADISGVHKIGTPAYIAAHRLEWFDVIYSLPTKDEILFLAPPLSYISNVYYLPFNGRLWITLVVYLFLVIGVMYIITKWERADPIFSQYLEKQSDKIQHGILESSQLGISVVCQQGAEKEPGSVSGRIWILCSLLAFMFLSIAYSANIITLLQSTSDNVKTPEDIVTSKIRLGAHNTPYFKYFMSVQSSPVQKQIYQRVLKNKQFLNLDEGLTKVREEYYGFHTTLGDAYIFVRDNYTDSEKCRLRGIYWWSMGHPYSPFKKNSFYKELIRVGYSKLQDRGIQHRLKNRVYVKKPPCEGQSTYFTSISLIDSYFAYVILISGSAFSFAILVLELVYRMFIKRKQAALYNKR